MSKDKIYVRGKAIDLAGKGANVVAVTSDKSDEFRGFVSDIVKGNIKFLEKSGVYTLISPNDAEAVIEFDRDFLKGKKSVLIEHDENMDICVHIMGFEEGSTEFEDNMSDNLVMPFGLLLENIKRKSMVLGECVNLEGAIGSALLAALQDVDYVFLNVNSNSVGNLLVPLYAFFISMIQEYRHFINTDEVNEQGVYPFSLNKRVVLFSTEQEFNYLKELLSNRGRQITYDVFKL